MHAAKVYHQSTAEPRNVSIILQPKASHLQIANYSLRPKINVVLACNEIHLIKAMPSTNNVLYRKTHRANKIFSRYYFSSSNSYGFIEDLENQINNTVFNQNW